MNDKLIIYQIFTRLFTNDNDHCVPNGTIEENGCGKLNDITPRVLASIAELGVTHGQSLGGEGQSRLAVCHQRLLRHFARLGGECARPYGGV